MSDSSGTTLMDLITSDPSPAPASVTSTSTSTAAYARPPSPGRIPKSAASTSNTLGKPSGERKSTRATLMQIQNDTISAAKALNPVRATQRQRKKTWHVPTPKHVASKLASDTSPLRGQHVLDALFPSVLGGICAIPVAFGCSKTFISQALSKRKLSSALRNHWNKWVFPIYTAGPSNPTVP